MQRKLIFIILLIAIIVPLTIYNGTMNDFVPGHMAIIDETVQHGYNSDMANRDIPGFYDFGTITSIVIGKPAKEFLFLPIQLIPFISVFFCLIYRISNNYFLSSIITFVEMISDVTGSTRVYLLPHGLGYILFYIILLVLLSVDINENRLKKFKLPIIIVGISLVFVSYNLHILSLIYLFVSSSLFMILWLRYKETNVEHLFISKNLFYIFVVVSIAQLGLSNFLYGTIITTYKTLNVELSGIDKILLSYSQYGTQTLLEDIYLTFPNVISILSVAKYLILYISIIIFMIIMINRLIRKKDAYISSDLFLFSLILTFFLYSILRISLGGMIFTLFYWPGIFATIWLYRSGSFKKWAVFVILIVLIIVPTCYSLNYIYNTINKDENKFENIRMPTYWYFEHKPDSIFSIAVTDELTKGMFHLYALEKDKTLYYTDIKTTVTRLSTQNTIFLIQKTDKSGTGKYFIINYNLNSMNLDNWIVIKSWKFSKDKIESNIKIHKIYDVDSLAFYEKRNI